MDQQQSVTCAKPVTQLITKRQVEKTKEVIKKVVDLYKRGASMHSIAQDIGTYTNQVRRWLACEGVLTVSGSFTCRKCNKNKARRNAKEKDYFKKYAVGYLCSDCIQSKTEDRYHCRATRKSVKLPKGTYQQLIKKQKGMCAICETAKCSTGNRFAVDHCHSSGKVRVLLCMNCNSAIGKFNDSVELLQKSITYITACESV
jgi:hypothetical protein